MNQENIGKIIAKKRREKNLTQEQLSNQLKIGRTTISKWERGIGLPDILMLQPLCDILDITIDELLSGEQKDCIKNQVTLEAIKYYNNKTKRKFIVLSIIFTTFLIAIFTTIIFINAYSRVELKEVNFKENEFVINGYILTSHNKKVLLINNINYNDSYMGTELELKPEEIEINLYNQEQLIYSFEKITNDINDNIDDLLNKVILKYDFTKEEIKSNDLYLELKIKEQSRGDLTYTINLTTK